MNKTKQDYKEYIGMFLTIIKRDKRIAKGVLKGITSDGKLKVKGDYASWVIDPSNIFDISARPNREGRKYERG